MSRDTQSRSSQEQMEPTLPFDLDAGTFYQPGLDHNPVAAVGMLAQSTATSAIALQTWPVNSAGDQSASSADAATSFTNPLRGPRDWRVELKARYKAMPRTAWFRATHEGRSLGESIKIS